MTTFLVIPRRDAGTLTATSPATKAGRQDALHRQRESHVGLLRAVLVDTGLADAAISVEGTSSDVAPQGSAGPNRARLPLSLDALGIIVLRNPSATELEKLRKAGAQVIENFEVDGARPVRTTSHGTMPPDTADLWNLDRIGARRMHQQGFTGKGTLIGVVDTGVDPDHPELAGRVAAYAAFDRDGNRMSTVERDFGDHGTHVCGTIAGKTCGVAPGARLVVAAALTTPSRDGGADPHSLELDHPD